MAVIISVVASVATVAYAVSRFFPSNLYKGYGDKIQDMVTLNLPHNNLTMTARLMYSFGLLASFPLQILPAFEISEKTKIFQVLPTISTFPRVRRSYYY